MKLKTLICLEANELKWLRTEARKRDVSQSHLIRLALLGLSKTLPGAKKLAEAKRR